MLQNIEQQYVIELTVIDWGRSVIQIVQMKLMEMLLSEGVGIDADDSASLLCP
jgi:hypothetical protein